MSFPKTQALLKDPNVWIGDTGATVHMTPYEKGMTNLKEVTNEQGITMGNMSVEKTTKIGDIDGNVCDQSGNEKLRVKMKDVAIVPSSGFNLFSITKMMLAGWKLSGEREKLVLTKNGNEITFDIAIPTPKGVIFAIYIKRDGEMAGAGADAVANVKLTIQQAHERLGHCGEDATRKAAKQLGWELTQGVMKPCDACTVGKAKQKNVPKVHLGEPLKDGEHRVFLDISSVKHVTGQPKTIKPNWRIIVDERTQLKFSDFFDTKNGMIEPTCVQLSKWKRSGKIVTHLRLDNAGENVKLKERCESSDWKLDIKFEFTARDTPQQNSLAEVSFATIANRGRALMWQANIPYEIRFRIWSEAMKTATLLDGLIPIEINGVVKSKYEHWAGKNPTFANKLRTWERLGR